MRKFVLILICILFVSCTKNNYEVKNVNGLEVKISTMPNNPNFSVELTKVNEIHFNKNDSVLFNPTDICMSKKGDIFVYDSKIAKVFKFDNKGNFLFDFGQKGYGPFESTLQSSMTILKDKIYINSLDVKKTNIFDLNGNGIKEVKFTNSYESPGVLSEMGSLLFSYSGGVASKKGELYSVVVMSLFDENLRLIRELFKSSEKLNNNSLNSYTPPPSFDIDSNGNIYKSKISRNDYEIDVFDKNYKKIKLYRKNTTKIYKETENENENLKYKIKKENAKFLIKSIMEIDKDNYLWVSPALKEKESNSVFDIFKDGIFVNRIKLPIKKNNLWKIENNHIIVCDKDNMMITLYSYNYTEK